MPRLGKRLLKIAEFIAPGSRVADIGTDHAVLPIHLIRSGLAEEVIATDIAKKPLLKAAENIDAAALSDLIQLRLGNGLDCIGATDADTIVIAGMGGELIADILEQCPWLRSSNYRLILQPMSRSERLRDYLMHNRFKPVCEVAGTDAGRFFTVIVTETEIYNGEFPPFYNYCGLLFNNDSSESREYLRYTANLLLKRADMIPESERVNGLYRELAEAADYINQKL